MSELEPTVFSRLASKGPSAPPSRTAPAEPPGTLHACMLAYTFYENDGRVMRYAEALVQAGAQVDAIVLGREGQPREEFVHGVRVIRVQTREKNERGKLAYFTRIVRFLFRSMREVTRQHWRRGY